MKSIALLGRFSSMERFAALADILNNDFKAVKAEPVEYTDVAVEKVEKNLIENFQYVICWVDPVCFNKNGEEETRALNADRSNVGLDQMLRRVAAKGVKVSTHPDIIERMGTKRVLYETRDQPWGLPTTNFFRTQEELRKNLGKGLISDKCRVLKMERGSSGRGVWRCDVMKGEEDEPNISSNTDTNIRLRVQHAGDDTVEYDVSLNSLLGRLEERMKATGGGVVDMPFLPGVNQGIIRCYMFRNRCGGILHQLPLSHSNKTLPSGYSYPNLNVSKSKRYRTKGLPTGKCVHPPNSPDYEHIVKMIEEDWIPKLVQRVGLSQSDTRSTADALPVVWDIDFILRTAEPKECSDKDEDTPFTAIPSEYVLCEINVSCVFPAELMNKMAHEIADWVA